MSQCTGGATTAVGTADQRVGWTATLYASQQYLVGKLPVRGRQDEGEPRWYGLIISKSVQSLSNSTEFCRWSSRASSITPTIPLWSTVTRGFQSPPGCGITQPNRLRMLKRRER